jgi:hypothetical protein
MLVFFAGIFVPDEKEYFFSKNCHKILKIKNRLYSYAERQNTTVAWDLWMTTNKDRRLFLDSGAFTAFTQGITIDLKEYVEFIKQNKKKLFCYAALDVIGDYKATRKNYNAMRSLGVKPLPAFHFGSPYEELHSICKEKPGYIALGGLVPLSSQREVLRQHLDACWAVLRKYWPIKVHAFGITAQWVLERYPFYSCDSTAAVVGGGMGRVITFDDGKIKGTNWKDMGKDCLYPELVDKLRVSGSAHLARRKMNIETTMRFEKYLTELWKSKGITWKD